VDALRALRHEVADGGERTEVAELLRRLEEWKQGRAEALHPVDVWVRLREDCPMRAARALALLRLLREHAQVEEVAPPEEAIARGNLGLEFTARVRAREPESLQELLTGPDVEAVRVMPAAESRDERWLDLGPQARGKLSDDPELDPPGRPAHRAGGRGAAGPDHEPRGGTGGGPHPVPADRATAESGGSCDPALAEELLDASAHLGRVASDLQAQVLKTRMLPIEHLFSRFPRYVRDLARRAGKEVEVVLEGQDVELDRSMIEQIGGPLMHLVRNAVDHGIEPPEERERARQTADGPAAPSGLPGGRGIVVVVEDDGRGIDTDRVRRRRPWSCGS
jgi:two-component system, chemotaxis family, sensor kinase CheA